MNEAANTCRKCSLADILSAGQIDRVVLVRGKPHADSRRQVKYSVDVAHRRGHGTRYADISTVDLRTALLKPGSAFGRKDKRSDSMPAFLQRWNEMLSEEARCSRNEYSHLFCPLELTSLSGFGDDANGKRDLRDSEVLVPAIQQRSASEGRPAPAGDG